MPCSREDFVNPRIYQGVIGLALLGLFAGCSERTRLTEVEGTVTLNGKAMENVRVEFLPDPENGTTGPRSTGVTDAQGRFKLDCENGKSGAVVGTHRVLITDLNQWEGIRPTREDSEKPLKPSRVPDRYADAVKTPFKGIEVKPSGAPVKLEITTP